MLGATGGRFLGPPGSHPHRNLWPPTAGRGLEFQTNGEVTESLFAAGGYNTPPASSPFMSVSPLELVAKNFHSGAVAFSQANSIFVQSQTDYLSSTSVAKKTETCIGRWEHGSLEPLQIHVPPLSSVANITIKSENISSGSSREKFDGYDCHQTTQQTQQHYHHTSEGLITTVSPSYEHSTSDITSGCSRTIPISWTPHSTTSTNENNCASSSCTTLLQIKREPCQVSEVTTSNNLGPNNNLTPVVKIESPSPKQMDHGSSVQNSGAIPVGIAVARQRLQENANVQQPKDINRFGIGLPDIGGVASTLSQNMFFTGTNSTMIPLTSEALTMGVSNVQNAVRTPPTLWQYPTPVSMDSMLPMPLPPPVGFQLVRDPATGQFLFLPAAALEPLQQAVVWPTYPQPSLQPSHLLIPPIAQPIQPPPLAPLQLLGSDYLTTASTTLHQHTQTHSTRLVALTETKRKAQLPSSAATIPLPIPSHTLIKIDDCTSNSTTCSNNTNGTSTPLHHHSTIFEQEKSTIQTIATVQNNEVSPNLPSQLYYHNPASLIQIAPHSTAIETAIDCQRVHQNLSPPSVQVSAETSACLTPPPEQINQINEHDTNLATTTTTLSREVQDANIQTDSPIMSEDDNTNGCPDENSSQSNEMYEENNLITNKIVPITTTEITTCHTTTHISNSPNSESYTPVLNLNHNNNQLFNNTVDINEEKQPLELTVHSNRIENITNHNNNENEIINDGVLVSSSSNSVPNLLSTRITDNEKIETKFFGKCDIIKINIPIIKNELNKSDELSVKSISNGITDENLELPDSVVDKTIINQNEINENQTIEMNVEERINEKISTQPVDLSGLELLSNSIEAFEKKTFIKQEPKDDECESRGNIKINVIPAETINNTSVKTIVENDGELEGLNLLCALAEQRFNEEVVQKGQNLSRDQSPEPSNTINDCENDMKKRKRRHSKSNKKSKRKKKHHSGEEDEDEIDEEITDDKEIDESLKETLNRVKAKYSKCVCNKKDNTQKCCKEKCNWPSAAEIFNAMDNEMKMRLADMTRKCQEKKKELDEYFPMFQSLQHRITNTTEDQTQTEEPEILSISSINLPKSNVIPIVSPNFSISSHSESNLIELPKLSSDTESSKFDDFDTNSNEKSISSHSSSKRKLCTPKKSDNDNNLTETIFAKKHKSLVGYILASKNRMSDTNVKGIFYTNDNPHEKKNKHKLKTKGSKIFIKSEDNIKNGKNSFLSSQEENNVGDIEIQQNQNLLNQQTTIVGFNQKNNLLNFNHNDDESSKSNSDQITFFENGENGEDKKSIHKSSKHHSKHKKSRSKERKHHRRSSEIKERKRKIDSLCTLTCEHLEKENVRVITAMGGLFYAGRLSALEPPDIYAVTLDGERGNRPHIMSREDILRDAIVEVAPHSIDELPSGTRVCAFWSQQYRCLYPGTVAEPGTPDLVHGRKFVNVEFDDGDNGRIAIEDIRFLLSDYPIVVYDPNPLLSLQKRKRRSSQSNPDMTYMLEHDHINIRNSINDNSFSLTHRDSDPEKLDSKESQHRERRRLKKLKKDKLKQSSFESNPDSERKHRKKHRCGDELCKHRKHKKRRKHKKHHRENEISAEDEISSRDETNSENFKILNEKNIKSEIIGKEVKEEEKFDPTIKEETMTEEEVASSITESSGSYYEPHKKKERQNSVENRSKIAAFLPARQLWAWSGKGTKRTLGKGRHRKVFFKMIQRGKEIISVGDSAVFLSTGRPDRPYIGRIESMWETSVSNMVVRVKWFYHPEETEGCPKLKYPGALFESPHEDENDVQTISHKCEVLPLQNYTNKFGPDPRMYISIYDNNDTYYLAGHYDPTAKALKFQPNIPTLENNLINGCNLKLTYNDTKNDEGEELDEHNGANDDDVKNNFNNDSKTVFSNTN